MIKRTKTIPYKCPVCEGSGYFGMNYNNADPTQPTFKPVACPSCKETGIVWGTETEETTSPIVLPSMNYDEDTSDRSCDWLDKKPAGSDEHLKDPYVSIFKTGDPHVISVPLTAKINVTDPITVKLEKINIPKFTIQQEDLNVPIFKIGEPYLDELIATRKDYQELISAVDWLKPGEDHHAEALFRLKDCSSQMKTIKLQR